MRCFVRQVKGNWHAAFDHAGVSYTQSLRTKSEQEADVRVGVIRDSLYRLQNGTLVMPTGADPKAFILRGGQATGKPQATTRLAIGQLADLYLGALQGVEENTRLTLTIHLNHIKRVLKSDTALDTLFLADADRYARTRLKESHHGKLTQAYTVRKELRTFRRLWVWAAEHGHTTNLPTWKVESVSLPKDRGREQFHTYDQIARTLKRGGLSEVEEDRLWETLYLNGKEVAELLAYAREKATAPWVYPMFCMVALTGCRRSEMVRSRIDDWDLEHGHVMIREKKRDTSTEFTLREVNLHPLLSEVMTGWFHAHPGGQHAVTAAGERLTDDKATYHFNMTLQDHEKWSKVRGFHTLRHSVASILASKSVDQRYIDKISATTRRR